MNTYEKPPLGVKPTYVSSSQRIKELAQAILNNSDRADLSAAHIHLWASEILAQVYIIQKSKEEWSKL